MKTKTDIQLELLQEIDEVCSKNHLKYILFEIDGLNPFHKTKEEPGLISVAMTQGDIDRFSKIIEENCSESRYVEGIFNNPRYIPIHVSYGNRNTTDIQILELSHNIHYGIQIIIHPINKSANLNGTRIEGLNSRLSKEKKIRETLNKRIENPKFWYVKTGLNLANGVYSLTGGGKRYFNEIKKNISIDKWEDIENYSEVNINNIDISTEEMKEIKRIELQSVPLLACENSAEFFHEKMEDRIKQDLNASDYLNEDVIIDTEIGYEEVFKETKDILLEAKGANEEIAWKKVKVKDELKTVKNVWNLVEMTNQQVNFIQYYKEKTGQLSKMDLNDSEQLNEVYKELNPVILELKKYAKLGMTFTIDPETDRLIEEVLMKKGEEKFIKKLKNLREKEYFVE